MPVWRNWFTRTTQNRVSLARVGSSPTTGTNLVLSDKSIIWNREVLSYLIGVSLGDGNLSKLNNRSVRLRIFCDAKYPKLINKIKSKLEYILPLNKVNISKARNNCITISSYSNLWEGILEWKSGYGTKYDQSVRVPKWIWSQDRYVISCLEGLLETDGTIYYDRGYPMVMFISICEGLSYDVDQMFKWLGFESRIYSFVPKTKYNSKKLYHVRLSKNVKVFLNTVHPIKA